MRAMQVVFSIAITILFVPIAYCDIIEIDDLNIIDDPGNPSNGLRFLDMAYSVGLTKEEALNNARAKYPNARLATPDEFNDLFASSQITYTNTMSAADGFTSGSTTTLSDGSDYDGWYSGLGEILGSTGSSITRMWTDPDGTNDDGSTRDYVNLDSVRASIIQSAGTPPWGVAGWLIVSEAPTKKPQISVDGGYIKLDTLQGGNPLADDCSSIEHLGRMVLDDYTDTLYVCSGSGWVAK